MADEKKQKKAGFSLDNAKVWTLVLIGFAIGAVISFFLYKNLMEIYLSKDLQYVEQDWSKVEYSANRLADQVIKYRKMLTDNRVKFDKAPFDSVLDIRARIIGGDTAAAKAPLMAGFDRDMNAILEFYNSRMDLRNERFSYIEWGMATGEFVDEYNESKAAFNDTVNNFNGKLTYPLLKGMAAAKKYKAIPFAGEGAIVPVRTATEEYDRAGSLVTK